MSNEELIAAVREEVHKELAPIYEQMEALRTSEKKSDTGQEEKQPTMAEAYLKQKEYEAEHLTGRNLGIPDTDEKKI